MDHCKSSVLWMLHIVCVCQSPVPLADVVMLANGDTDLVNPWRGLCFPLKDLNDSVKQLWCWHSFGLFHWDSSCLTWTWFTVTLFTPECWLFPNLWFHHRHNCPNFPTAAPPPILPSTSQLCSTQLHSFQKKVWAERLWASRVCSSLTVSSDVSHGGARVTLLSL